MSNCVSEEQPSLEPSSTRVLSSSPVLENMGVFSRLLRFSPLGSKTDNPVPRPPKSPEPTQVYYGVYIPCESKIGPDEEMLHVYTDRVDALKIVKKYKKARFKALRNRQEAVVFALRGAETLAERSINQSVVDAPVTIEITPPVPPQLVGGEKPSQFKGPKPQEMVQFRKSIEAGDMELVKKTVWDNPRYLVSSGDTPSILQEGSRYNALHVGVKTLNVQMCDFLLATISDPQFVQLLFGDDNIESSKTRATILLDLYLNMPDKAMNETPLHFAVKFGAKEIVDLLVSYPQCSRTVINKFGDQPKDIICQRCKVTDATIVADIALLLREQFYVPVLHSEDSTRQPVIGEPFSPASPPTLNSDPISPRVEIRAFAGPMDKNEAATFRRKWKTPPRSAPIGRVPLAAARFRLTDVDKGLEKVGRDLAQKLKIGWREYWPFLDTFTDLTSPEGLELLEEYLKKRYITHWNTSSNAVTISDSYLNSSKVAVDEMTFSNSVIERSSNSPQKNMSKDANNALSPVSDLCLAMKSCSLSKNANPYPHKTNYLRTKKLSEDRNNQGSIEDDAFINTLLNPGLSPYMCVEKSCEVFAKRISHGIAYSFSIETEMVVKCLKSETKHLQQTVASYMDDPRFHTIDFHLIHSRVAQLIAQKLKSDMNLNDDLDVLKSSLKEISIWENRGPDTYSSDEDELPNSYRTNSKDYKEVSNKKTKGSNAAIKCVANNVLVWMADWKSDVPVKPIKNEEECIDIWSDSYKCQCPWQTEQFFKNCRKNASLKRSQIKCRDGVDILSSSPKNGIDQVSRRLRFDSDGEIGEGCNRRSNQELLASSPKSDKNHNFPGDNILSGSPNKYSATNHIEIPEYKCNGQIQMTVEKLLEQQDDGFEAYFSDEGDDASEHGETFMTPLSNRSLSSESSGESDYEEADDGTLKNEDGLTIDVFIQGDKPTKMDKAVYDAINNCSIDLTKYPYVYQWRHAAALVPQDVKESWPSNYPDTYDDIDSPITCSFNLGHISTFETSTPTSKNIRNIFTISRDGNQGEGFLPSSPQHNGTVFNPIAMLTPKSGAVSFKELKMNVTPPMQVSKWMRVTGPNSPRAALANKHFRPNVSFGF